MISESPPSYSAAQPDKTHFVIRISNAATVERSTRSHLILVLDGMPAERAAICDFEAHAGWYEPGDGDSFGRLDRVTCPRCIARLIRRLFT